MRVPNADQAIIAPEKLRDYLLNPEHRRGGTKARLLLAFGYRREEWGRLEADLRSQHLSAEVAKASQTDYGQVFEIIAPIVMPNRRSILFCSIWQMDTGTERPRLITMYPR